MTINNFFEQMLLFFPTLKDEYIAKIQDNYEGLDTIIIEDIFMPAVIDLLRKNSDINLLTSLFDYFEEVSVFADDYLLNVFSITTLEILGNDHDILAIAKKYMGPETSRLQYEADVDLGRVVQRSF